MTQRDRGLLPFLLVAGTHAFAFRRLKDGHVHRTRDGAPHKLDLGSDVDEGRAGEQQFAEKAARLGIHQRALPEQRCVERASQSRIWIKELSAIGI
jgi:hypothetical protein